MATPAMIAAQEPGRLAIVFEDGELRETYGELEARSRRIAVALRRAGLQHGDNVAVLVPNHPCFFDIFWACHRAGLYFTPVNWHLQQSELDYIIENSDASAFFAAHEFGEVASRVPLGRALTRVSLGGAIDGFAPLEQWIENVPEDAKLEEELEGAVMLYSSGTTGRPKGVRRPLLRLPAGDPIAALGSSALVGMFGMSSETIYLSPAPLYHAAPLTFAAGLMRLGACVVIMRRFDPERALHLIQAQGVTASQWVPTHFKRLLMLPAEVRARYDVSRLELAVHAAAPCPLAVKRDMIEWWGRDVIVEYYAGTEGGGTLIRGSEWLDHVGSVGRHWTGGRIHILDERGEEITQAGREGAVYFEAPANPEQRFRYYKDPEKTAGSYRGALFTLGDIGYLDAGGYLYLTDRQSNMIISGGVNIYPQEIENQLLTHSHVADCAVIGVPNDDMGEEVKAVVVPRAGVVAGRELERLLIAYCREHIAHYKAPRSVDFVSELPRTETGKMAKRLLRDRYWSSVET